MNTQLKKGVLDLCILSKIKRNDSYGYDIYQSINKKINISESTIYPTLRKFVKGGYCETYLKESQNGPARKYFKITEEGIKRVKELESEWEEFKITIEEILKGGEHNE